MGVIICPHGRHLPRDRENAVIRGPTTKWISKPAFGRSPAGVRHWMNGNITKEGIKLDIEWMQRVGPGGIP